MSTVLESSSFLYDSTSRCRNVQCNRFQEFSEEDYRKFVQTLSDGELTKTGKQLRWLSGREDRLAAECVSRAVEDLQSGMAKAAFEMIGV